MGNAQLMGKMKRGLDGLKRNEQQSLNNLLNDPNRVRKHWKALDFNGNGKCSLAEIDKYVVGGGLNELKGAFNNKPALMRAYKATVGRKDYVTASTFKTLLRNIFYFNALWEKFSSIDSGGDRRMDLKEFTSFIVKKQRIPLTDDEAAEAFGYMDRNGGGQVLFDEFCKIACKVAAGGAFTSRAAPGTVRLHPSVIRRKRAEGRKKQQNNQDNKPKRRSPFVPNYSPVDKLRMLREACKANSEMTRNGDHWVSQSKLPSVLEAASIKLTRSEFANLFTDVGGPAVADGDGYACSKDLVAHFKTLLMPSNNSKMNPLLARDRVGKPKTFCGKLPPSMAAMGTLTPHDAEGAGALLYTHPQYQPSKIMAPQLNIVRMNKDAIAVGAVSAHNMREHALNRPVFKGGKARSGHSRSQAKMLAEQRKLKGVDRSQLFGEIGVRGERANAVLNQGMGANDLTPRYSSGTRAPGSGTRAKRAGQNIISGNIINGLR